MAATTCLLLAPSNRIQFLRSALINVSHVYPGLEITTLEPASPYGELMSSVSESIYRTLERADLIIADISGGNPNVMYELGFAHALKKPVLPLVYRGSGAIPSDLSGYLYFAYDPEERDKLIGVVKDWIARNRQSKSEA